MMRTKRSRLRWCLNSSQFISEKNQLGKVIDNEGSGKGSSEVRGAAVPEESNGCVCPQ